MDQIAAFSSRSPVLLKTALFMFALSCMLAGCVGMPKDVYGSDLSRVNVRFEVCGETIDLLGLTGLDMGPMYSSNSFTPKFVGNSKHVTYTSYDEVELDKELTIRWRLSSDHTRVFEELIKRPESIPATVPREHIVIFRYSRGMWTIGMKSLQDDVPAAPGSRSEGS